MHRLLASCFLGLALSAPAIAAPDLPGDREALKGAEQGRLLWDVTEADAIRLSNWLTVILDTYEGLERHGLKAHMVLVFRAGSVRMLLEDLDRVPLEQMGMVEEVHTKLRELKQLPRVRMEVCNLALRRQGLEGAPLVPQVKVVTNAFIAIAGYNERGYARVPVR